VIRIAPAAQTEVFPSRIQLTDKVFRSVVIDQCAPKFLMLPGLPHCKVLVIGLGAPCMYRLIAVLNVGSVTTPKPEPQLVVSVGDGLLPRQNVPGVGIVLLSCFISSNAFRYCTTADWTAVFLAFLLASCTLVMTMLDMRPIIEITTRSSIKVNPLFVFRVDINLIDTRR
jgi:hypothetical protein